MMTEANCNGVTVISVAEPGQRTAVWATPGKGVPISSPFSCRLCSPVWQEVSALARHAFAVRMLHCTTDPQHCDLQRAG